MALSTCTVEARSAMSATAEVVITALSADDGLRFAEPARICSALARSG
jgi:hypothetical protein